MNQILEKAILTITFIYLFAIGANAYSHGNSHSSQTTLLKNDDAKLKHINTMYSDTIRPIFENKCLVCHGGGTKLPWYHTLPLAKQLMERDMKEGIKHLDISNGFPFKGHGSPMDDFEAIEKVVEKKSMPPMRYWILHWQSRLSESERQAILNWVSHSKKMLANHTGKD